MAKKARTAKSTSKSKPASARAPKGPSGDGLDVLRVKIDSLDERIVRLLNERARVVETVGKLKRASGVPVYVPHREQAVLSKVLGLNEGPLPNRTIEAIYRELMSGSFRLEQPPRIAYLGPPGSYSHVAAVKQFGSSVDFEPVTAIEAVFTEVARGHVDYGLAPIENSTGGGITESLDAFKKYHRELNVYAEVQIEVHHCLMADCAPTEVVKVYSKPEAFVQCRGWLATHYPRAELAAAASTARAVELVRDATAAALERGEKAGSMGGVAAIGSKLAGSLYGVNVLFENIEDEPNNITRFLVLSKQKAKRSDADKTSIMFTTADKPGALVEVLTVFQRAGINLTHIDKRPSGRVNWTYTFFVDAEGHIEDPFMQAALKQVEGHCRDVHVLGSYPKAKRIL